MTAMAKMEKNDRDHQEVVAVTVTVPHMLEWKAWQWAILKYTKKIA
jgi:hypothetical protein